MLFGKNVMRNTLLFWSHLSPPPCKQQTYLHMVHLFPQCVCKKYLRMSEDQRRRRLGRSPLSAESESADEEDDDDAEEEEEPDEELDDEEDDDEEDVPLDE